MQALLALVDVEVEGRLAERRREDQRVESLRIPVIGIGESVADVDQQETEGRDALLAVDQIAHTTTLRCHDRSQEIRAVRGDILAFVSGVELVEESTGQVVDEFANLGASQLYSRW